jgi:hypothetical protein
MARNRDGNSRNLHQKAGAHNAHPKMKTQGLAQDETLEGSRKQDQKTQQKRGREGRRGNGDRRSMSPERGDVRSGQQANHRDNRRSRTPLPANNIHDRPNEPQQIRGSATTAALSQVSAKRKRAATEDDGPHANKKAHSGPGDMQPTAAMKVQTEGRVPGARQNEDEYKKAHDLTAVKNMSEEDRRKLRDTRFKSTPIEHAKAVVLSPVSQGSKSAEPRHRVKDDRKATITETQSKAKVLIPLTPSQNTNASSTNQSNGSSEVATTESREEPIIRATVLPPKPRQQSAEKITDKVENQEVAQGKTSGTAVRSSPILSQADILSAKRSKRKLDEVDNCEVKSPKKLKVNHDAIKRRNAKIIQSLADHHLYEDENRFPEEGVTFVDYDAYSIPLLCSPSIDHQFPFELLSKPSDRLKRSFSDERETEVFSRKMLVLRQEALRLSRKKFWTSEDLGRETVSKLEPTKVIGDCDLYLYNKKVHVATERGLLLAAEYLKLIGVPDTQPVRFHGKKPAWMDLITAKPEHRRVLESWDPTAALKEGGCISIAHGSTVVIYEHGIFELDTKTGVESQMAYGAREDDGITGWFDYSKTCRMDWLEDPENITAAPHDPAIIDWATFDYGPLVAHAAARQAAQLKSMATARVTATRNAFKVSHPPTTPKSVSPTLRKTTVASPVDATVAAGSNGEQQVVEHVLVADISTQSATNAESSGLCTSRKEELPQLSTAGRPISRQDSPNSRTATEGGSDPLDEHNASQGTIDTTLSGQTTDTGYVVEKVTAIDPFSNPLRASSGHDGLGGCQASAPQPAAPVASVVLPNKPLSTVSQRYEVEVDWDDTDLQENEEL